MKGKDAVEVNGGEITITAGSDGIQSNNNGEMCIRDRITDIM